MSHDLLKELLKRLSITNFLNILPFKTKFSITLLQDNDSINRQVKLLSHHTTCGQTVISLTHSLPLCLVKKLLIMRQEFPGSGSKLAQTVE